MPETKDILKPFASDMRHLTSGLNVVASDMIRDRFSRRSSTTIPTTSARTTRLPRKS